MYELYSIYQLNYSIIIYIIIPSKAHIGLEMHSNKL